MTTHALPTPMRVDDPDSLLTPAALADRWSCSLGWLANRRSAGTGLPFVKVGALVRYRLSDVLAYETASIVEPVGPALAG